ncbi:MAG: glycosyltransferase family 39 protein [bacterium]
MNLNFLEREKNFLAILFVTALLVRLCVIFMFTTGSELLDGPDQHYFNEGALNILKGEGYRYKDSYHYEDLRSFRLPLTSMFFAGIYSILGHSYGAVRIIQAILSALVCLLIYFITKKIRGSGSARIAGIISVFYYGLIVPVIFLFKEILFGFLLAVAILYFLKIDEPNGRRNQIIAGITLGLSALTAPYTLSFPGFILIWLFEKYRNFKKAILTFLFILIPFLLVLTPWVIRNYRIHHVFILSATEGGFGFWVGNNPWAKGCADSANLDFSKYAHLSEVEKNKAYYKEGLKYLLSAHPFRIAKLCSLKILTALYPFLPVYDFSYALIFPFWLWGMWLGIKSRKKNGLLLYIFLNLLIVVAVFEGEPRMRESFSPYMIVFAAVAVSHFFEKERLKRAILVFSGWFLINYLVFIYSEPVRLLLKATFNY